MHYWIRHLDGDFKHSTLLFGNTDLLKRLARKGPGQDEVKALRSRWTVLYSTTADGFACAHSDGGDYVCTLHGANINTGKTSQPSATKEQQHSYRLSIQSLSTDIPTSVLRSRSVSLTE